MSDSTAGSKLQSLEQLKVLRQQLKATDRKLVLCHGHFNTIHPGHLRFLQFAREQGDALVIAVMNLNELSPQVRASYFDQRARALNVAALDMVDAVYCIEGSVLDVITAIEPEVFVKGREFEEHRELIADQISAVESHGGKVVFGSGEVEYSATSVFGAPQWRARSDRYRQFIEVCSRNGLRISSLFDATKTFEKVKLMVVGDTIVDQFVSCDVLGVSAEAPVMTIRELQAQEFVGGAAIIACHAQTLGAACTYVSVVGDDAPGEFLQRKLGQAGVAHLLLRDSSRPTTYKIRYMVEHQKMLRVSRLRQHALSTELEETLIDRIAKRLPGMDGIVVADFVYGVLTPRVLSAIEALAKQHGVKLFGDLQCSSQTGDASRFRGTTLLTPTEREARIALGDQTSGVEALASQFLEKTGAANMVLKLGAKGLVTYTPRADVPGAFRTAYFPALESHPVDVSGAGDALLATMAVGMCAGLDVVSAAAAGTCSAAISVGRVGNVPVTAEELVDHLHYIQQHEASYSL